MRSGADQLIFVGTSTVGYIKFNVIKLFIINYHINDNLKIIKNKKLYILNIRTEFVKFFLIIQLFNKKIKNL